jgi:hypothetical protein
MSVARTMNLFRATAVAPRRVAAVRSFQSCKVLSVGKETEIRKSRYYSSSSSFSRSDHILFAEGESRLLLASELAIPHCG